MGGSIPSHNGEEDSRSRSALKMALDHIRKGRKSSFMDWVKELRSRVLIEGAPIVLTPDEMVTLLDGLLPPHSNE